MSTSGRTRAFIAAEKDAGAVKKAELAARPRRKSNRVAGVEIEVSEPSLITTASNEDGVKGIYHFNGVDYDSYEAMVKAKRERNQNWLVDKGLIQAVAQLKEEQSQKAVQRAMSRKRKVETAAPSRKSNRLAGVEASGLFVESESSGKFTVAGSATENFTSHNNEKEPENFRHRINDGSDLSIKDAVELCEPKWVQEDSIERACQFLSSDLVSRTVAMSPTSVVHRTESLISKIAELSVDDDNCVAKVTPNRIYSVACHPSPDSLIVCAGDKQGYVGMWKVDEQSAHNGVHLFRVHNNAVSCLAWTPTGDSLLSTSYDGTVRWFDVKSQIFSQIFATFDDSLSYRKQLGYGLDEGRRYWIQYVCPDQRNASEKCFFLSTSVGTAMHVDLRVGNGKLTFHEELSEKKINTLSLHSDGHVLVSAGLDCVVRLWDIRKFGDRRRAKHSSPEELGHQLVGRSINSAFFSPNGSRLLSTTMANSLDITHNAHLATSNELLEVTKRIRHDNVTGRWLSTLMAQWHPHQEIFVVGSMQHPRTMEVFDGDGTLLRGVQGGALTAVTSRCCFHPSQDKLVLVGGNSSGRVTVVR